MPLELIKPKTQKNKGVTRKIIARKVFELHSVFSKALGLMFSFPSRIKDSALIFVFEKPQKASLHMFFVFYPIDVLFLNRYKKVIEIKRNFLPFTWYCPKQKSSYVIELAAKSADGVLVGDRLQW